MRKQFYSDMDEMQDEPASGGEADDGTMVQLDEAGALVTLDDATPEEVDSIDREFDANLADEIDENERIGIGQTLREYVEADLDSRMSWERRLLAGLEIIGLEDVPNDRTAFEGAAAVTHPAIAEAIVQFQARAVEEMLPPTGPVKCGAIGDAEEEDENRAIRVEEYMNYQLTDEDDEYYQDTDSMLFYLPYAGSAFKKVAIDPVIGRTRSRYITSDDFIVPYGARSLKTATRYTHRYTMPLNVFKRAVEAGSFTDYDFSGNVMTQIQGDERRLRDESDEATESYHPDDINLQLCETHIDWDFEWDKEGGKKKYKKPYVITWEWETGAVVSIRRLWAKDDEKCSKEVWFVHYKYLPGFGFYGLGLLHLIGSLGRAASGALRALLDGATTASLQGGFKSKDAKIAGDVTFAAGEWLDTDMTADEMQKAFYTPPFKEPSVALFNTLKILLDGIQRFTSTTEAMVGDASNNGPVGTTVAMIEQGSKVFSGIHKRLHQAARLEFKLIAYCNFRYMEQDEYPYKVQGGDRKIFREDFAPDIDVLPVSDPNIFSSVQRIALAQAVMQMAEQNPDVFTKKSKVKAIKNMLRALKVPDYDEYIDEESDQRLDPISENESMMIGRPVNAFIEQDHQAHMQIHSNFMQEVLAINDPDTINKVIPMIKSHIAQHFAMMYRQRIEAELSQKTNGVQLPGFDPNNPEKTEELPIELENIIARAVATYVAPPQPAQAPGPDPEAQKDQMAQRDADRQDMLAQRESQRKDISAKAEEMRKDMAARAQMERDTAEQTARLKREGIIPDMETPPLVPAPAVAPSQQLPQGP